MRDLAQALFLRFLYESRICVYEGTLRGLQRMISHLYGEDIPLDILLRSVKAQDGKDGIKASVIWSDNQYKVTLHIAEGYTR